MFMGRALIGLSLGIAATALVIVGTVPTSNAQQAAKRTILQKAELADLDQPEGVIITGEIPPGWRPAGTPTRAPNSATCSKARSCWRSRAHRRGPTRQATPGSSPPVRCTTRKVPATRPPAPWSSMSWRKVSLWHLRLPDRPAGPQRDELGADHSRRELVRTSRMSGPAPVADGEPAATKEPSQHALDRVRCVCAPAPRPWRRTDSQGRMDHRMLP